MTSLPPSPRDVAVARMLVVAVVVLGSLRSTAGCILLLDGWSPMTAGQRAGLADIVAVGEVRRTFKSEDHQRRPSSDAEATYSAEVRLSDVFKGRRLVDGVPFRPEVVRGSTSGSQTSGVTQSRLIDSSGLHVHNSLFNHRNRIIVANFQVLNRSQNH